MFKILFIIVGVDDVLGVFMPQCTCLGQRTSLWNVFPPSTFTQASVTQFRSKSLHSQNLYLLSHLYQPYMFLLHKNSIGKTGLQQMRANGDEEVMTGVRIRAYPKFTGLCVLQIDNECIVGLLYHIKIRHIG